MKNRKSFLRAGFTLVELLIVIGILAVLATTAVMVLNPAQFLAQSRDADRVSDLRTLEKAVSLAVLIAGATDNTQAQRVYLSLPDTNADTLCDEYASLPALSGGWEYRCMADATTLKDINGSGWLPIDLTSATGMDPPLAALPVDPENNETNYYAYAQGSVPGSYSLAASMESIKYESFAEGDGGTNDGLFETSPVAFVTVPLIAVTNVATGMTQIAATLNGSANPMGNVATAWFRYSTMNPGSCNDTFGIRAPSAGGTDVGSGSTAVDYSQSISGLTAGTTYYFCAIAQSSAGTAFGSILSFSTSAVAGNDRYWIGGTGNWSDTAHWSTTSGGGGGASVPGSTNNIFFNAASGVGTVTVNATANTADLNFTGFTGTFAGSSSLNISGSLTLGAGMVRTYTGSITFTATSAGKTITSNGVKLVSPVTFNGVGGSWILQDNFNNYDTGAPISSQITVTNGTFDTNGYTLTTRGFQSSNSNVRTVIFGTSTINIYGQTFIDFQASTNLTFSGANATLDCMSSSGTVSFNGGGKTFGNVTLRGFYHLNITGTNTFTNLTITGTSPRDGTCNVGATQTVTGTLTMNGQNSLSRLWVKSTSPGTARTLSASVVSVSNVDLQDIAAAGTGNWNLSAIVGGSGDAGGNSGITFTPTQNHYWVATSGGNWSSTASWSTVTGGSSGARVPLPQDDVFIDANSITSAGRTISGDMPRLGRSVSFTGVLNSPTYTQSNNPGVFGNLTLIPGMTFNASGNVNYFYGRGNYTLTPAGQQFWHITLAAPGGTLTLNGNLVLTRGVNNALGIDAGTFSANNYNLTAYGFSQNNITSPMTVNMGSGTWECTGWNTPWGFYGANVTLNSGTSTIKFTDASVSGKTLNFGGKTYNKIWITGVGTGTYTIIGSNTIGNLTVDSAPKTVNFTGGTTQTIATFAVTGTAGNLIALGSTNTSNFTLTKAGGGTVNSNYLSISHSTATPASTWFAGPNSVDGGNNSGWTF